MTASDRRCKCSKAIEKDWNHCPYCGSEIPDSDFKTNPVGVWSVSTEGDCEGRTMQSLGTHTGHIADIARSLAPQVSYRLYFSKVKCSGRTIPAKAVREVSIDVSGMPDLKITEGKTGVKVTRGNNGAFKLTFE